MPVYFVCYRKSVLIIGRMILSVYNSCLRNVLNNRRWILTSAINIFLFVFDLPYFLVIAYEHQWSQHMLQFPLLYHNRFNALHQCINICLINKLKMYPSLFSKLTFQFYWLWFCKMVIFISSLRKRQTLLGIYLYKSENTTTMSTSVRSTNQLYLHETIYQTKQFLQNTFVSNDIKEQAFLRNFVTFYAINSHQIKLPVSDNNKNILFIQFCCR